MIDDTRVNIKIYGGAGDDFFQIGQLYKSQRTPAAGVPNADVFATLETTRGFLSNGISAPMQIFGGAGDDEFVVYHNLAPLQLYGEDGDDFFLIRAFALVGSSGQPARAHRCHRRRRRRHDHLRGERAGEHRRRRRV
jgi:hypothetical protein